MAEEELEDAEFIVSYNKIDQILVTLESQLLKLEIEIEKNYDEIFAILDNFNTVREARGQLRINLPPRRGKLQDFIPPAGAKFRSLDKDILMVVTDHPGSDIIDIERRLDDYGVDYEEDGISIERIFNTVYKLCRRKMIVAEKTRFHVRYYPGSIKEGEIDTSRLRSALRPIDDLVISILKNKPDIRRIEIIEKVVATPGWENFKRVNITPTLIKLQKAKIIVSGGVKGKRTYRLS